MAINPFIENLPDNPLLQQEQQNDQSNVPARTFVPAPWESRPAQSTPSTRQTIRTTDKQGSALPGMRVTSPTQEIEQPEEAQRKEEEEGTTAIEQEESSSIFRQTDYNTGTTSDEAEQEEQPSSDEIENITKSDAGEDMASPEVDAVAKSRLTNIKNFELPLEDTPDPSGGTVVVKGEDWLEELETTEKITFKYGDNEYTMTSTFDPKERLLLSLKNNNPGNVTLHPNGNTPWDEVAIGLDIREDGKGYFAVYGTQAHGMYANLLYLSDKTKKADNLESIIYKYAPPNENPTEEYINFLEGYLRRKGYTNLSRDISLDSTIPGKDITYRESREFLIDLYKGIMLFEGYKEVTPFVKGVPLDGKERQKYWNKIKTSIEDNLETALLFLENPELARKTAKQIQDMYINMGLEYYPNTKVIDYSKTTTNITTGKPGKYPDEIRPEAYRWLENTYDPSTIPVDPEIRRIYMKNKEFGSLLLKNVNDALTDSTDQQPQLQLFSSGLNTPSVGTGYVPFYVSQGGPTAWLKQPTVIAEDGYAVAMHDPSKLAVLPTLWGSMVKAVAGAYMSITLTYHAFKAIDNRGMVYELKEKYPDKYKEYRAIIDDPNSGWMDRFVARIQYTPGVIRALERYNEWIAPYYIPDNKPEASVIKSLLGFEGKQAALFAWDSTLSSIGFSVPMLAVMVLEGIIEKAAITAAAGSAGGLQTSTGGAVVGGVWGAASGVRKFMKLRRVLQLSKFNMKQWAIFLGGRAFNLGFMLYSRLGETIMQIDEYMNQIMPKLQLLGMSREQAAQYAASNFAEIFNTNMSLYVLDLISFGILGRIMGINTVLGKYLLGPIEKRLFTTAVASGGTVRYGISRLGRSFLSRGAVRGAFALAAEAGSESFEEFLQYAANEAAIKNIEDILYGGGLEAVASGTSNTVLPSTLGFVSSLPYGFSKTFKDKEGRLSMVAGGIMGFGISGFASGVSWLAEKASGTKSATLREKMDLLHDLSQQFGTSSENIETIMDMGSYEAHQGVDEDGNPYTVYTIKDNVRKKLSKTEQIFAAYVATVMAAADPNISDSTKQMLIEEADAMLDIGLANFMIHNDLIGKPEATNMVIDYMYQVSKQLSGKAKAVAGFNEEHIAKLKKRAAKIKTFINEVNAASIKDALGIQGAIDYVVAALAEEHLLGAYNRAVERYQSAKTEQEKNEYKKAASIYGKRLARIYVGWFSRWGKKGKHNKTAKQILMEEGATEQEAEEILEALDLNQEEVEREVGNKIENYITEKLSKEGEKDKGEKKDQEKSKTTKGKGKRGIGSRLKSELFGRIVSALKSVAKKLKRKPKGKVISTEVDELGGESIKDLDKQQKISEEEKKQPKSKAKRKARKVIKDTLETLLNRSLTNKEINKLFNESEGKLPFIDMFGTLSMGTSFRLTRIPSEHTLGLWRRFYKELTDRIEKAKKKTRAKDQIVRGPFVTFSYTDGKTGVQREVIGRILYDEKNDRYVLITYDVERKSYVAIDFSQIVMAMAEGIVFDIKIGTSKVSNDNYMKLLANYRETIELRNFAKQAYIMARNIYNELSEQQKKSQEVLKKIKAALRSRLVRKDTYIPKKELRQILKFVNELQQYIENNFEEKHSRIGQSITESKAFGLNVAGEISFVLNAIKDLKKKLTLGIRKGSKFEVKYKDIENELSNLLLYAYQLDAKNEAERVKKGFPKIPKFIRGDIRELGQTIREYNLFTAHTIRTLLDYYNNIENTLSRVYRDIYGTIKELDLKEFKDRQELANKILGNVLDRAKQVSKSKGLSLGALFDIYEQGQVTLQTLTAAFGQAFAEGLKSKLEATDPATLYNEILNILGKQSEQLLRKVNSWETVQTLLSYMNHLTEMYNKETNQEKKQQIEKELTGAQLLLLDIYEKTGILTEEQKTVAELFHEKVSKKEKFYNVSTSDKLDLIASVWKLGRGEAMSLNKLISGVEQLIGSGSSTIEGVLLDLVHTIIRSDEVAFATNEIKTLMSTLKAIKDSSERKIKELKKHMDHVDPMQNAVEFQKSNKTKGRVSKDVPEDEKGNKPPEDQKGPEEGKEGPEDERKKKEDTGPDKTDIEVTDKEDVEDKKDVEDKEDVEDKKDVEDKEDIEDKKIVPEDQTKGEHIEDKKGQEESNQEIIEENPISEKEGNLAEQVPIGLITSLNTREDFEKIKDSGLITEEEYNQTLEYLERIYSLDREASHTELKPQYIKITGYTERDGVKYFVGELYTGTRTELKRVSSKNKLKVIIKETDKVWSNATVNKVAVRSAKEFFNKISGALDKNNTVFVPIERYISGRLNVDHTQKGTTDIVEVLRAEGSFSQDKEISVSQITNRILISDSEVLISNGQKVGVIYTGTKKYVTKTAGLPFLKVYTPNGEIRLINLDYRTLTEDEASLVIDLMQQYFNTEPGNLKVKEDIKKAIETYIYLPDAGKVNKPHSIHIPERGNPRIIVGPQKEGELPRSLKLVRNKNTGKYELSEEDTKFLMNLLTEKVYFNVKLNQIRSDRETTVPTKFTAVVGLDKNGKFITKDYDSYLEFLFKDKPPVFVVPYKISHQLFRTGSLAIQATAYTNVTAEELYDHFKNTIKSNQLVIVSKDVDNFFSEERKLTSEGVYTTIYGLLSQILATQQALFNFMDTYHRMNMSYEEVVKVIKFTELLLQENIQKLHRVLYEYMALGIINHKNLDSALSYLYTKANIIKKDKVIKSVDRLIKNLKLDKSIKGLKKKDVEQNILMWLGLGFTYSSKGSVQKLIYGIYKSVELAIEDQRNLNPPRFIIRSTDNNKQVILKPELLEESVAPATMYSLLQGILTGNLTIELNEEVVGPDARLEDIISFDEADMIPGRLQSISETGNLELASDKEMDKIINAEKLFGTDENPLNPALKEYYDSLKQKIRILYNTSEKANTILFTGKGKQAVRDIQRRQLLTRLKVTPATQLNVKARYINEAGEEVFETVQFHAMDILDLIDSMTLFVAERLFTDPDVLLDPGNIPGRLNTLYNEFFEELEFNMELLLEKGNKATKAEKLLINKIRNILKVKKGIIERHKLMISNLGFDINVNRGLIVETLGTEFSEILDNYEDTLDDEAVMDFIDNTLRVSQYTHAAPVIKLMLHAIPNTTVKNQFGFYTSLPITQTWGTLSNLLAGTVSFDMMMHRLNTASNIEGFEWINYVINNINKIEEAINRQSLSDNIKRTTTVNALTFKAQFYRALSKARVHQDVVIGIKKDNVVVGMDKTTHYISYEMENIFMSVGLPQSEFGKSYTKIVNSYYKKVRGISPDELKTRDGQRALKAAERKLITDLRRLVSFTRSLPYIRLLEFLGFEVSPMVRYIASLPEEELQYWDSTFPNVLKARQIFESRLKYFLDRFFDVMYQNSVSLVTYSPKQDYTILDLKPIDTWLMEEGKRKYEFRTNNIMSEMRSITRFLALVDGTNEVVFRTSSGSQAFAVGNYTTLTRIIALHKESDKLGRKNPYSDNTYRRHSLWNVGKLTPVILSGIETDGKISYVEFDKMVPSDIAALHISAVLTRKAIPVIRSSDRSVEYGIVPDWFLDAKRFNNYISIEITGDNSDGLPGIKVEVKDPLVDIYWGYFMDEIEAFVDGASNMSLFSFLGDDITDIVTSYIKGTTSEELLKEYFYEAFKDYYSEYIRRTFAFLADPKIGIIEEYQEENGYRIDSKVIKRLVIHEDLTTKAGQVRKSSSDIVNLVALAIVNLHIGYIEQLKNFFGPIDSYKQFFKRTTGLTSAGFSLIVDKSTERFIKETNYEHLKKTNKEAYRRFVDYIDESNPVMSKFGVAIIESPVLEKSSLYDEMLRNVKEILIESEGYSEERAEAEAKKIVSKYQNIEYADGQAWMTFEAYRHYSILNGTWTTEAEKVYIKYQNGSKLNASDMITIMNLKPMYFGAEGVPGMLSPLYLKTAVLPIVPGLYGSQLGNLAKSLNMSGAHFAIVDSGVKVGPRNKNMINNSDFSKAKNLNVVTGYWSMLKDQQKVGDKGHGSLKMGVQIINMAWTDMNPESKVYYQKDGVEKELTVEQLHTMSMRTMRTIMNKNAEKLLIDLGLAYRDQDGKLVFTGPEEKLSKIKGFIDFYSKANRDANPLEIDELYAIITILMSLNETDLNLDLFSNSVEIQSVLTKNIREKVTRIVLPGLYNVQVSSYLFTKESIKTDNEVDLTNDKIIWLTEDGKPRELKFARVVEEETTDGKRKVTEYGEILLPYSVFAGLSKDVKEKILSGEYKVSFKEDADKGILYRIPTQGPSSSMHFKVVGILPDSYEHTVVIPAEIVTQADSDFDFDKLSILLKAPVVKVNNKIKSVIIGTYNTDYYEVLSENDAKEIWEYRMLVLKSKDAENFEKELKELFNLEILPENVRLELDLILKSEEDKFNKVIKFLDTKAKKEFINYVKGKHFEHVANMAELKTRLVRLFELRYKDPSFYPSLISTASTSELKSYAKQVRALKGEEDMDSVSGHRLIEFDNVINTAYNYLFGKTNVSIGAITTWANYVMQRADIGVNLQNLLKRRNPRLWDDKKAIGKTTSVPVNLVKTSLVNDSPVLSLSAVKDINFTYISSTLSRFMSSFLDVAKDPFVNEFVFITEMTNLLTVMLKAGVTPDQFIFLMNQPAVKLYFTERLRKKSALTNLFNQEEEVKEEGKEEGEEGKQERKQSKGDPAYYNVFKIITDKLKKRELPGWVRSSSSIELPVLNSSYFSVGKLKRTVGKDLENMSSSDLVSQVAYLKEVKNWLYITDEVTQFIDSIRFHNLVGKNFEATAYNLFKFKTISERGTIHNIDNIRKTFPGLFLNIVMDEKSGILNHILRLSKFSDEYDYHKTKLGENVIGRILNKQGLDLDSLTLNQYETLIRHIKSAALLYSITEEELVELAVKSGTKGKTRPSLVEILMQEKNNINSPLYQHPFFDMIKVVEAGHLQGVEIKTNYKFNEIQKTLLDFLSLLEVLSKERNLPVGRSYAEDFIKLALIKDGLNYTKRSILAYAPQKFVVGVTSGLLNKVNLNNPIVAEKIADLVILHLTNDNNIVPKVLTKEEGEERTKLSFERSLSEILNLEGVKGLENIIAVPIIETFDRDYLKHNNGTVYRRLGQIRVDKVDYYIFAPVHTLGQQYRFLEYAGNQKSILEPTSRIPENYPTKKIKGTAKLRKNVEKAGIPAETYLINYNEFKQAIPFLLGLLSGKSAEGKYSAETKEVAEELLYQSREPVEVSDDRYKLPEKLEESEYKVKVVRKETDWNTSDNNLPKEYTMSRDGVKKILLQRWTKTISQDISSELTLADNVEQERAGRTRPTVIVAIGDTETTGRSVYKTDDGKRVVVDQEKLSRIIKKAWMGGKEKKAVRKSKPVERATTKTGFKLSQDKLGKDQGKADLANAYIGFPVKGRKSSTEIYLEDAKRAGIPVNYNIKPNRGTVAFVSVASEGTNVEETIKLAKKVIEAGGTVIMDASGTGKGQSHSDYNKKGEGAVQDALGKPTGQTSKGYNYWGTDPEYRKSLIEKLKSGELKGKPIEYYKDIGQPSHATVLDYLINKFDWNKYGTSKQSGKQRSALPDIEAIMEEVRKYSKGKTESPNVRIVDDIWKNAKNPNVITAYRTDKSNLLGEFEKHNNIGNPIPWKGKEPGQASREFLEWLMGGMIHTQEEAVVDEEQTTDKEGKRFTEEPIVLFVSGKSLKEIRTQLDLRLEELNDQLQDKAKGILKKGINLVILDTGSIDVESKQIKGGEAIPNYTIKDLKSTRLADRIIALDGLYHRLIKGVNDAATKSVQKLVNQKTEVNIDLNIYTPQTVTSEILFNLDGYASHYFVRASDHKQERPFRTISKNTRVWLMYMGPVLSRSMSMKEMLEENGRIETREKLNNYLKSISNAIKPKDKYSKVDPLTAVRTTENGRRNVMRIIDKLAEKTGINIIYINDENSHYKGRLTRVEGKPAIIFNLAYITEDTGYHEFMHYLLLVTKENDPNLFDKVLNILQKEIENTPELKAIYDQVVLEVKKKYGYESIDNNEALEEAIVTTVGYALERYGDRLAKKETSVLVRALRRILRAIRSIMYKITGNKAWRAEKTMDSRIVTGEVFSAYANWLLGITEELILPESLETTQDNTGGTEVSTSKERVSKKKNVNKLIEQWKETNSYIVSLINDHAVRSGVEVEYYYDIKDNKIGRFEQSILRLNIAALTDIANRKEFNELYPMAENSPEVFLLYMMNKMVSPEVSSSINAQVKNVPDFIRPTVQKLLNQVPMLFSPDLNIKHYGVPIVYTNSAVTSLLTVINTAVEYLTEMTRHDLEKQGIKVRDNYSLYNHIQSKYGINIPRLMEYLSTLPGQHTDVFENGINLTGDSTIKELQNTGFLSSELASSEFDKLRLILQKNEELLLDEDLISEGIETYEKCNV